MRVPRAEVYKISREGVIQIIWSDDWKFAIHLGAIECLECIKDKQDVLLYTFAGQKHVLPGVNYEFLLERWVIYHRQEGQELEVSLNENEEEIKNE